MARESVGHLHGSLVVTCTVETVVVNQNGRTVLEGVAESKVMRVKSRSA
jgi:hypothetical protein